MKFPKMILPILAMGSLGLASFAAPPFSGIEKTPETKGSVFYSMKTLPNGFSLAPGYDNNELTGKQNPNPIKNQSGTCTFSPQVAYLPAANANRGDKYLTLSYIYENAQVSPTLPTAIKKKHVSAGNTFLEVLTSSFDVPASKSSSDNKNGYYRTIAVRAIDATVSIPYVAEKATKGLPAIVMTYDCQTENDYKDEDFSSLLGTVDINLMDTISNAAPNNTSVDKPTQAPAPTTSPTPTETPSERSKPTMTGSSTGSPTDAAETESSPVASAKPSNP